MKRFESIVYKSGNGGMVIGAAALVIALVVMIANIVYRLFGGVIPGTYELIGLFVGISVTFALPFTAMFKRHVSVNLILSRLPQQVQDALQIFTSLIEFSFWAVVAWTTLGVIHKRWLMESTLDLQLPMLPFRSLWLIGLIIFCSVLLIDVVIGLHKGLKK